MQNLYLEKQNLIKLYNEELIPFLFSQEYLRKKRYLKFVLLKIVSLCVLLLNFIIIYTILYQVSSNFIELNKIVYFLLSIFCSALFCLSNFIFNKAKQLKQSHQNLIKKYCLDKILREIGNFKSIVTDETSQDANEYKIWEEAHSRIRTDISQKFIRYSYEDIIEKEMYLYSFPPIKAYLSKIELTKISLAKFIYYKSTIFEGLIISIDLKKKFNNKILLTTDINSSLLVTDELKKIKNISKNIKLYAQNNSDLEFITHDFVFLIKNLKTGFRSKNINIFISNAKAFITIKSNSGIFEITDLSKNYNDPTQFKNFVNEFFALKQLFKYFEKMD